MTWPVPTTSLHGPPPLLRPRAGCPANTYHCPASLGPAFNDICCENGQICATDSNNNPACCPQGAVCTGTAPATAPTAPAGSPSYVLNSYFPFPYASTTFGNSAACSSAVQSCSRNYDACLTKLQNGNGYHVTVAVPGDTGTTVTGGGGSFPGSQATYICSSLSLVACEAVGSATCTSFGQDSGTCNVTPASSSWLLLLLLAINLTW